VQKTQKGLLQEARKLRATALVIISNFAPLQHSVSKHYHR